MTTQQTEQQPSQDALAQAVQEAVGQLAPEQAQQPVYVTKEEAAKMAREAAWEAVRTEGERIRRQMQSAKDKEVAEIRRDFEVVRNQVSQSQDASEIQRITSIQDETERNTAMMLWMSRKVAQPSAQAQQTHQPEPPTATVVEDVQQRVRAEIPELYLDIRLWDGTNTALSADANMDIIRRNAATLRGQRPSPSQAQPAAQQTPQRQPQSVPVRTSPAAGGTRMSEEEVEDWLAKEPSNPQALKAYKEMQARQGRTV